MHLWGRRGGPDALDFPHIAPAPARRVEHAWSQVAFVPGHPGEVLFVQGCSPRVMLTTLPKVGAARPTALPRLLQTAAVGRFGLLDGSRVVALDGHQAQVRRKHAVVPGSGDAPCLGAGFGGCIAMLTDGLWWSLRVG